MPTTLCTVPASASHSLDLRALPTSPQSWGPNLAVEYILYSEKKPNRNQGRHLKTHGTLGKKAAPCAEPGY